MTARPNPSLLQSLSPGMTGVLTAEQRAALGEIDRSCRWPVLMFYLGGIIWLLIGTLLALVASWKMHDPAFLSSWGWLNFGRVRPAHLNAVIYGFANQAAVGTALWLMCRLCRVPLMHGWMIITSGIFWNVGVVVGTVGILIGDSTGIEWLEFPSYATPILFFSYALIGVWAIITFRFRREHHLYVSQWYLLAAFLWFPWLYSAAEILLVIEPVRGTVQSAVNWWFAHNVLGLWFTPIGLATAYYFIPKVIGRPIHSYYLSALGFWSLALFYNWNGMHHLVGGPMPAWLVSVSIVASVMMMIPVVTVAINHHLTMRKHFHMLTQSPTLLFIVFGAMNYTATSVHGALSALRSVSEVTHFTHHTIAHAHHGMYAFFTMTMFGAMYYIIPRLTQREWPSSRLIYLHFWACGGGIMIYVISLTIGGVFQGLALKDPSISFLNVVALTRPYLVIRSLSGMMIAVGHLAFSISLIWIMARQLGPYRQPLPVIIAGTSQPSSATAA
jgi:cytochrome c oxidase cbb3-type subunit I